MASVTLKVPDRLPPGATVAAYPRENFPAVPLVPSGEPVGSATQSVTADATTGEVAFTTLAADTEYVAYTLVDEDHRYVSFRSQYGLEIAPEGPDEAITYSPPGTLAPEGGVWAIRLNDADAFRFGYTPIVVAASSVNAPALMFPSGSKIWEVPGFQKIELEGYFGVNTPGEDTNNVYIDGNVSGDSLARWVCRVRDTSRNFSGAVFEWAPSGTQSADTRLGYVSTGILGMRANSSILRVRSTNSGTNGLALTTPGIEVAVGNVNATTSRTLGAFKFMSYDAELTTESPKLVAAVAGRATETYSADTSGGAALDFHVTANAPGTTNVPVIGMSLLPAGLVLGTAAPTAAPTARLTFPAGTTVAEGLIFGADSPGANLYRTGASAIKTDGALTVGTSLTVLGNTRLGDNDADTVGFYSVAGVARQTIAGSRGGNAALADLLTKLAATGLITDGTSA